MRKITMIAISLMVILGSCAKDGVDGVDGIDGAPGADGNANVKTEIIKVFSYEWEESGSLYVVDKTSDLLTQDIVDNGSAHLYLEGGESIWIALPYSTMGYGVGVNDLGIWTEGNDVTNQTTTFKLVVIQGNMQTRSKDVDFSNYQEVKTVFNLKEEEVK